MCQQRSRTIPYAQPPRAATPAALPPSCSGSRRRRLWELDGHAYCPVIGVCLPLAQLRKLADKAWDRQPPHDDYELHCLAVTECRRRSALAEAVQKELESRYALVLRAAQPLKSTEALGRWWDDCRAGADWAGALWAALTHPRCNAALEHRILGEVHMLQHQVGMACRADLGRLEALHEENAILARELAGAQARSQQQTVHYSARLEEQQAIGLRLRAELVQAQTRLHQQQEQLDLLLASTPDLAGRQELAQRCRQQEEQLQALQRQLQQARQAAERQPQRAEALQPPGPRNPLPAPPGPAPP
ncbi:MAG: DUF2325 domain-containing protein, partial [Curvibacter sp.]